MLQKRTFRDDLPVSETAPRNGRPRPSLHASGIFMCSRSLSLKLAIALSPAFVPLYGINCRLRTYIRGVVGCAQSKRWFMRIFYETQKRDADAKPSVARGGATNKRLSIRSPEGIKKRDKWPQIFICFSRTMAWKNSGNTTGGMPPPYTGVLSVSFILLLYVSCLFAAGHIASFRALTYTTF